MVADIAAVLKLFNQKTDLTVHAKVPKGEKNPPWEQVAANRAVHLKELLSKRGVLEENITTKGVAPGKDDAVMIQIDKTIFAEPPKKGGKK